MVLYAGFLQLCQKFRLLQILYDTKQAEPYHKYQLSENYLQPHLHKKQVT